MSPITAVGHVPVPCQCLQQYVQNIRSPNTCKEGCPANRQAGIPKRWGWCSLALAQNRASKGYVIQVQCVPWAAAVMQNPPLPNKPGGACSCVGPTHQQVSGASNNVLSTLSQRHYGPSGDTTDSVVQQTHTPRFASRHHEADSRARLPSSLCSA